MGQGMLEIASCAGPTREQIEQLEEIIRRLPQIDMPINHEFVDGLYARTMKIPMGTIATGAIHKSENFLFVREGYLTIWTDNNKHELTQGAMVLSSAGCKRVALAHTDVLITTVHPNPENITDEDKLWEMYTFSSAPQLNHKKTDFIQGESI